jgi:hypothetical protein
MWLDADASRIPTVTSRLKNGRPDQAAAMGLV